MLVELIKDRLVANGLAGTEPVEKREPDLWDRATRHPFLQAVGQGRAGSFDIWLAQDALFVADLLVFQSRLVARAPRAAQPVIAGGVVGLVEELDWFDRQADELGVSLSVEPLEATRAYRALLHQLDAEPYPRAVLALWLVERVYLDSWRYAGTCGPAGPHAAAIAHWTDPAFVSYVTALEEQATAAVQELDGPGLDGPGLDDTVPDIARAVLTCEVSFWDMAQDPA